MGKTRAGHALKKVETAMNDMKAGKISRPKALNIILVAVNDYCDDTHPYKPTQRAGADDD